MNLKRIAMSLIGSFAVTAAAAQQPARPHEKVGPMIHHKYSQRSMTAGSLAEKDVDCGLMTNVIGYPQPQPWVTCAFLTSADNNSTAVCNNTDWIPLTKDGQKDMAVRFMNAQSNPALLSAFTPDQRKAFDRAVNVAAARARRGQDAASIQEQDFASVMQADLSYSSLAALKHSSQLHNTCIDGAGNNLLKERIEGGTRRRTLDEVNKMMNKTSADIDRENSTSNWIRWVNGKVCDLEEIMNKCTVARGPQ